MNEKLVNMKNRITGFWESRSKKQQYSIIGAFVLAAAVIAAVVLIAARTPMQPLYSNLPLAETASIKENLDSRGIASEIADNGQTILVPAEMVDTLKVELAAEGIPDGGSIDYSFFSQNAGMGMTDNEFNVLKLETMQTELSELIKGIEGINDAKVMINLPEEGIFINQGTENASASIVLDTKAGYQFEEPQIKSLYHLVSKSVPKLPTDNIVIMNQHFEYFDLENENNFSNGNKIADQLGIKKEIERDIQRQVQSMLGTIMGGDKVVVSVTTDIDFSEENQVVEEVEPVDEENMEGIAVSAQRLTETYSGEGAGAGGVPQGEDGSDSLSSYQEGAAGNGDYEKTDETINYEVNRIRREIVESPYKIRDLGIQVMLEPPTADDPGSLPQQQIDDVTQILGTIIRTTIDKDTMAEEMTEEELNSKIAVSVQEFNGKIGFEEPQSNALPVWVYIVGGVLLVALAVAVIMYLRARRDNAFEYESNYDEEPIDEKKMADAISEIETEGSMKKKQLEKLAKEKPDEFAKLLRTWLTQD